MKLQGEEEFAERVGLVGPAHTLHTDGNHPPGLGHSFARNLVSNFVYLQGHSTEDSKGDGGPEFAEVFVIVWVRTAHFAQIIFALCLFWLSSRLGQ